MCRAHDRVLCKFSKIVSIIMHRVSDIMELCSKLLCMACYESVYPYRNESGLIFITLLRTKNVEIRVKFVFDVNGKYGKNIGFPYWSLNRPDTVLKG